MRLSIAFDGSHSIDSCRAVVMAAEAASLDGIWSAEHLGLHDAVTASATYLTVTERIDVGLVGPNASSRHPGLLAMELASLAELGGNRVRAQLGTGDPGLAAMIGKRSARPLGEVEALLGAIRALHRGEDVTVERPEFTLDRFRLRRYRQPITVPLDVMAIRPAMLQLASRIGDGVALSAAASRAYLAEAVAAVERHLAAFGRARSSFRITAMVLLAVSDDVGEARRSAAKILAFSAPGTIPALTAGIANLPDAAELRATLRGQGPAAAAALYPAEVVDELAIVATPAGLPAALERYERLGIDELALTLTGDREAMLMATEALALAKQASPAKQARRVTA